MKKKKTKKKTKALFKLTLFLHPYCLSLIPYSWGCSNGRSLKGGDVLISRSLSNLAVKISKSTA